MEAKYRGPVDVDVMKQRRDRLEREALRITERLALLENLPEEPVFEDGEPSVVWFTRRYPRSASSTKLYTYAAVRSEDGLWYITGSAPGGRPWAETIQWIQEEGPVEVWVAAIWELLD